MVTSKQPLTKASYEESRKMFYRFVKEVQELESTLSENQEIHAFINGIEFCLEKLSLVNTHSNDVPALLIFCGHRPSGESFLHVQSLNLLNLSLSASRKEDAKSLRRSLIVEEGID